MGQKQSSYSEKASYNQAVQRSREIQRKSFASQNQTKFEHKQSEKLHQFPNVQSDSNSLNSSHEQQTQKKNYKKEDTVKVQVEFKHLSEQSKFHNTHNQLPYYGLVNYENPYFGPFNGQYPYYPQGYGYYQGVGCYQQYNLPYQGNSRRFNDNNRRGRGRYRRQRKYQHVKNKEENIEQRKNEKDIDDKDEDSSTSSD